MPASTNGRNGAPTGEPREDPRPALGAVEWFRVGEHERVERALDQLRRLGIRHLRTGVSWADWFTEGGADWYSWLLPRLSCEVEVLPCVLYTPPSLGVAPRTSSPPKNPKDYADFLDVLVSRLGKNFEYVELWNEPNNLSEWDWTLDPQWTIFSEMIGAAAYWMHRSGKKTVLGGMSPPDPNWLALMCGREVISQIDVVGIHGFPGVWESRWDGWAPYLERMREVLAQGGSGAELWITETGHSTWRNDEFQQLGLFSEALKSRVERVYWYSLEDLSPERDTVDGFHTDEREYHFGLHSCSGRPKLLARALAAGGIGAVRSIRDLRRARTAAPSPATLITGGAGFVGTNLAHRLLSQGRSVTIFDNLSRPGVERNLRWLLDRHGGALRVEIGDLRDRFAIRSAIEGCDQVFHLAAQVAVTTSLDDPSMDLDVNLHGTVNVLEEARRLASPPSILFTSTNKVYGSLPEVQLFQRGQRYEPVDPDLRATGIAENRPLEFRSPYGCSKGAADQYVLDYAHSYGVPGVVFRMSCVYGPHQLGTEDQGWVAHFLIRAIQGGSITIFGDGKQVRDVLFIDDLIDGMTAGIDRVADLAGTPFNIGGGPGNCISLLDLLDLVEELNGIKPCTAFEPSRPGDQCYYVSDTSRFQAATGWRPQIDVRSGVERLYRWLLMQRGAVNTHSSQPDPVAG
jgi:CDP-paratose 2-epimerase